jgi:hypothetical protein
VEDPVSTSNVNREGQIHCIYGIMYLVVDSKRVVQNLSAYHRVVCLYNEWTANPLGGITILSDNCLSSKTEI